MYSGNSRLTPPPRNTSLSRPSSRNSLRAARPSSPDDPVALRSQMSTLKHSIRHQQAQLHTLENIVLRGPRPLPPGMLSSPPRSPEMPEYSPPHSQTVTTKMQRRSSFDVLHGLAGEGSNLPLPRRETPLNDENGIREGIPMSFGAGALSPSSYKRASSPTRTLSRIPVSSVGNARALADEGQPPTQRPSPSSSKHTSPIDSENLAASSSTSASLQPPASPNKRLSLTPGGTTKVLADLQTGVVNARNALENTRVQLRLSQRSVAQLTRITEDLKEGRERLRLENEGLNNVVARKERLLQEVLERARKAESETATLKTQLKTEVTASKKSIREMESALAQSSALSQKSEREYVTLRDSLKSMAEAWARDTEKLREEMQKRDERWKKEAESLAAKYRKLGEEVRDAQEKRGAVEVLREEDQRLAKEAEAGFRTEIANLKAEVERTSKDSDESSETAQALASELARLRRLMRTGSGSAGLLAVLEQDPPP